MNAPTPTELLADFTVGSARCAPTVTLYHVVDGRRRQVEVFEVKGRGEARRVARFRGARPWNF